MIQKTDIPNLVRDTSTRALINTDNGAFSTYKENRNREIRVSAICDQVNNLQNDLQQIKSLLTSILNKGNNG